jgi:hypothetical protein
MNKAASKTLGPYILRAQAGKLILPNEVAQKIENLVPMEEGTLRTITGPAALVDSVPTAVLDGPLDLTTVTHPTRPKSDDAPVDGTSISIPSLVYPANMHGIFHCTVKNEERDILLLQAGTQLWEFTGWDSNWRKLISAPAEGIGVRGTMRDTTAPQFPTQFAATGDGVVIVGQDYRSYFYDGYQIAPLGFRQMPGAPQGMGPQSSKEKMDKKGRGVNDRAYTHDGTNYGYTDSGASWPAPGRDGYRSGMTRGFGECHVGTITPLTFDASAFELDGTPDELKSEAADTGWLNPGEYRCRVQFVDMFGNLSPLSPPSASVAFDFQPSAIPKTDVSDGVALVSATRLRKQIGWTNIPPGPDHTRGRILYRTKDLLNSGSADYFSLPQDAMGVASAFATLPDNITSFYPDNISDVYLSAKAEEIDPVPDFRLCTVAMGRLWVANFRNAPSTLRPSLPGRWGTFPTGQELSPDPAGGEITGLRAVNKGLLVFTSSSTFIIVPSEDGKSFQSAPISAEIGCVAPSSIQSMGDGRVVWLAQDGFYAYDGTSVTYLSPTLRKSLRRLTSGRSKQAAAAYDRRTREYRCWVATDGSANNNTCYIFDGQGWRTRTDVAAEAVCVTNDHREYMLIAGKVKDDQYHNGVFVLDHSGNRKDTGLNDLIDEREAVIETNWIQGQSSKIRTTAHVVNIWLRETSSSKLKVEVLRDWRNTTIEQTEVTRYSSEDVPSFYDQTPLDSGGKFVDRRPYWTRAQVYVPSNETFKIRISGKGLWEFVGIELTVSPRDRGGAMTPP